MNRIHNITIGLLLLATVILPGTSCIDENYDTILPESEEKEVTFRLALPADMQGATAYAMTGDDEQKINEITVLAFVKDNTRGGNFYYNYSRAGAIIPGGSFNAQMRRYSGSSQRFVILANCNAEIAASNLSSADKLPDALEKLTVTHSGEWPAKINGASDIKYIPMAAVTNAIIFNNTDETATLGVSGSQIANPIPMIRMLARIDVKLKSDILSSKFTLVNACIFNRKTKGHISYKDGDSNFWSTTNPENTAKKAWIPTGTGTELTPTENYNKTASSPDAITHSIYTFEAAGVVTAADKKHATAIIVGGKYNGASEVSYYRVDIPEFDGSGNAITNPKSYGDILRNHLYTITIQDVTYNGAPNQQTAFDEAVKVEAHIEDWNLSVLGVAVKDDDKLKIDKTQLRYDGTAKSRTLAVTAPSSVKWSASTSDNWITNVSPTSASPITGNGNLSFSLAAIDLDTGPASRTGSITLKAINFEKKIEIYQYKGRAIVVTNPAVTSVGSATGIKTFEVTYKAPWTATPNSGTGWLLLTTGAEFDWYGTWNTTNSNTANVSIQKTVATATAPTIKFTSLDKEFDDINYTVVW
ncbi:MAG: hypothetical protein LBR26_10530 [Prevotella sp.]|jgi:hypothetical protein|nr:hypothetical protein [Prevotella sp.]